MLSHVELNERLRTLNVIRRMLYSVLLAVLLVAGFVLTSALGITVMVVLATLLIGGALVIPEDIIVLGLPVLVAFLLTNGLVGLATREGTPPGETVSRASRAALRKGLIRGFVAGAIFGAFWALIIHSDVLLNAAMIGLSVSLAFGLFEALSSIAEALCLRLVANS